MKAHAIWQLVVMVISLVSATLASAMPGTFESAVAGLEKTPQAALTLVRENIAYRPYQGFLKGHLGAWNDRTGNAADTAALLLETLRHMRIRARLAYGTLDDEQVTALLESVLIKGDYPAKVQKVLPGDELAEPINDPAIRAAAAEHVWVQALWNGDWLDLDPTLPSLDAGQAVGTVVRTQTAIGRNEFRRLRIEVFAKTDRSAARRRLLFFEEPAAMLVGQRVTFLNLGLDPNARDTPVDPGQLRPALVVGRRVIDVRTTYDGATGAPVRAPDAPMGGIFDRLNEPPPAPTLPAVQSATVGEIVLEATLLGGGRPERKQRRVLYLAGEDGLNRLNDVTGFCVTFGSPPAARVQATAQQAADMAQRIKDVTLPTAGDLTREQETAASLMVESAAETVGAMAQWLAALSHRSLPDLDRAFGTLSDYNDARLVAVSMDLRQQRVSTDLIFDSAHSWALPGAKTTGPAVLAGLRGRLAAELEGEMLAALGGVPGQPPTKPVITVGNIFKTAEAGRIPIVVLHKEHDEPLAGMPVKAWVKQIIRERIEGGHIVVTPLRPVTLDGHSTDVTAWYEINPQTGEWLGVFEDGRHQAWFERNILDDHVVAVTAFGSAFWAGFGTALWGYTSIVIGGISHEIDMDWPALRLAAIAKASEMDKSGMAQAAMIKFVQELLTGQPDKAEIAAVATAIGYFSGQKAGINFLKLTTR